MRRCLLTLLLGATLCRGWGQAKPGQLLPEVLAAPVYPGFAIALKVQATVVVHATVDRDGHVTAVEVVEGPCREWEPSSGSVACDYSSEAAAHRALANQFFKDAVDGKHSPEEQRTLFKKEHLEQWIAAEFDVYAAAVSAARQWKFESKPFSPGFNSHTVELIFRFSIADSPSIQTIDPWSLSIVGTRLLDH